MSDLRTRLERIGDRARPTSDAFGRLERVRRRRERNRRIGAGVVALVVAMAGSFAAFSAFRGGGPEVAGGGDDFFALWPESTLEQAQAAQRSVESGDPDLQWRLDAEATALRFVNDALGRPYDPDTLAVASATFPDGVVTVEFQTPPAPCPSPPVPACRPRDVTVRLRQLVVDESGIWSVVSVESSVFNVPLDVGGEVEVGGEITIAAGLEDGTEVAVGIAGTGLCTGFLEETAVVQNLQVEVPIRGVQDGCAGYVYALMPTTPVGQVELGRIMFVYHEPRPALEYMIHSITAVPVRFVAAEEVPAAAPDVAEVTCDGATTTIDTPEVAAQPDGVHILVTNTSTLDLSLQLAGVGGDNAPPGEHEVIWPLAPGAVELRCMDPSEDAGSLAGFGTIRVVDPQGLYVSTELSCSGGVVGMSPAYAEGTVGHKGDPVEVAREQLTGLLVGDLVERAGYPDAREPVIRVVRDGAVVARAALFSDGQGGWLLSSLERCDEQSIVYGWSEEDVMDPYPPGWFEWCPEGPFLELGQDWIERASEAAVRFAEAYDTGDEATLVEVLDPSVPAGAEFTVVVAEGAEPTVGGTNAHGGGIVNYSCGSDVEAYTVAVTIDDGSDSASADFTVFLVLREDGWKVWGVY